MRTPTTLTADVIVTEVTGSVAFGGAGVAVVKVRAVPYNSSNLVRELVFAERASDAPRVGAKLRVSIQEL